MVASPARALDLLVGLECREEVKPFSWQQHQAQFGLNPALSGMVPFELRKNVGEFL